MIDAFLRFLLKPQSLIFWSWKRIPVGSFQLRLKYDVFPRPHYAFCTYYAARSAQLLGIDRISLIEFGVAGGNGLVELESLADQVEREFQVQIEIYGFDTGKGLPPPEDYRDLPYVWREGFFEMDVETLRGRLRRSELVLGDVKDTLPTFFDVHSPAPIGAVFMDLDYYSSTLAALEILRVDPKWLLPRVWGYFDDVISAEGGGIYCEQVGQLCAIRDYNRVDPNQHVAPIAGLPQTRRRPATWNTQIYVHHTFDHPSYNTYIHPDRDRQLRLE